MLPFLVRTFFCLVFLRKCILKISGKKTLFVFPADQSRNLPGKILKKEIPEMMKEIILEV
jgi:hypothetical protein